MRYSEFISEITKREGGKKNLSIAQVKEVVKHTRDIMLDETGIDIYHVVKSIKFKFKSSKRKGCKCQ